MRSLDGGKTDLFLVSLVIFLSTIGTDQKMEDNEYFVKILLFLICVFSPLLSLLEMTVHYDCHLKHDACGSVAVYGLIGKFIYEVFICNIAA